MGRMGLSALWPIQAGNFCWNHQQTASSEPGRGAEGDSSIREMANPHSEGFIHVLSNLQLSLGTISKEWMCRRSLQSPTFPWWAASFGCSAGTREQQHQKALQSLPSLWRALSLPTHSPSFSSWPGWQLSSCRQRKEPMVLTQCSLLWQVCLSVTHSLMSVREREHISATGCWGISLFLLSWKEQEAQMKDSQCSYSALMGDVFSPGSLVSTQWLRRHESQGDCPLLPSPQRPWGGVGTGDRDWQNWGKAKDWWAASGDGMGTPGQMNEKGINAHCSSPELHSPTTEQCCCPRPGWQGLALLQSHPAPQLDRAGTCSLRNASLWLHMQELMERNPDGSIKFVNLYVEL